MKGLEEFYVVKWSIDKETGMPVLLAAGRLGIVRVLDCHKQGVLWVGASAVVLLFWQYPVALRM